MRQADSDRTLSKEALKALRSERKEWITRATALAKDYTKSTKAVREALAASSATVPDIAAKTGLAPDKTLMLIASMKKFGQIVEAEKDGSFYRYALAGGVPSQAEE